MPFSGTRVTFEFVGPKAKEAAEVLWVQYLDGGLDQEIEARIRDNGGIDTEYEWDEDTGIITIKTTK